MRLAAADLGERLVGGRGPDERRAVVVRSGRRARSSTRRRAAPPGDADASAAEIGARPVAEQGTQPAERLLPARRSGAGSRLDPLSRSRRRDGRARRGPRSARRPCRVGVARGSKCRPASDERLARRPACEAKRLQTPGRGCRPLSPIRDPRTATYERRPDMEPRSTNRETRRNGTVARPPRRPAPIHPTTGAGPTNRIRRSSPNAQDPEDCAMRSIRIPGRHASDPGSPQEHEERPRARHRPRAPETGERSAALFTPVSTAHG